MSFKDIFRRVPVSELTGDDSEYGPAESHGLKRQLTASSLVIMGIAAIIGTGIFVLPGVAAKYHAGPAVMLSFAACGILCAFVALCYAEFASMIKSAGSAFMYAYATLGEVFAWIIGWDLLLEYAFGASGIAVGWSAYFQKFLESVFHIQLPEHLSHAPHNIPWSIVLPGLAVCLGLFILKSRLAPSLITLKTKSTRMAAKVLLWVSNILLQLSWLVALLYTVWLLPCFDLPAMLIVLAVSALLIGGVHHTAKASAIFVFIKLAVIIGFIVLGVWYIDMSNWTPFIPARTLIEMNGEPHWAYGWFGILRGAAVVLFAFIGFDGVTTAAAECKNPQRDVPLGVLGSLAICTVIYLLVAIVMTGCMSYTQLAGGTSEASGAPILRVLEHIGLDKWSWLISIGAIAGITSALIFSLYGQSRVQMSMANRGLIGASLGKVSPRFGTPVNAIITWGVISSLVAGLFPIEELSELTNIGTLAAFIIVCVGIIVLRYKEPERYRGFACPSVLSWLITKVGRLLKGDSSYKCRWLPEIPILGALGCFAFMLALPALTWERFIIWMALGFVVYFAYSFKNSKLHK